MWKGAIFLKEELGQHYRISLSDGFDGQLSLSSTRKKSQAITFRFNKMKHAGDSKFSIKNFVHTFYILYIFLRIAYFLFLLQYLLTQHGRHVIDRYENIEQLLWSIITSSSLTHSRSECGILSTCMIQSKIIIIMQ